MNIDNSGSLQGHLVPSSVIANKHFAPRGAFQSDYRFPASTTAYVSYARPQAYSLSGPDSRWYPSLAHQQQTSLAPVLPCPYQVQPALSTDLFFRPQMAWQHPQAAATSSTFAQSNETRKGTSFVKSKEPLSIAEAVMAADGSDQWLRHLQLIPASASLIAPHPALEDSGVPYAVFAADLIWDICQIVQEHLPVASPSNDSSGFAPYGTIGGERTHRMKRSADSVSSLTSNFSFMSASFSEQSSPLLTPPSSAQSAACPIPEHWQSDRRFTGEAKAASAPWSEAYWDTQLSPEASPSAARASSRSLSALASFRRFTEQLLSVTLVTPQTLLLALFYAAKIGRLEPEALANTFSAKSMPYKVFVGALVLSNKALDDNSYTSLTWSKVSAISLRDVTQAELFIFDHLRFVIDVKSNEWRSFIHQLFYRRAKELPTTTYKDPILARLRELDTQVR